MIEKPGRSWPGVGTGAIVTDAGHLLMIERAGAHGAGTWSVRGGWVEMYEDPAEGAVREVLEETGLEVVAVDQYGWTSSPHRSDGIHAVTLWVRCLYVVGEPRVMEPAKCPRVEWVPFAEVSSRPLFQPLDWWWPRNSYKIVAER